MRTFENRLAALEQRIDGPEVYIILFGDDCDAFDAAIAAGDRAAALDVLVRSNPYVAREVLAECVADPHRSAWVNLSPRHADPTVIRVEYGDDNDERH